MTHIGKAVVMDGELISDEDLQIDGQLKGHVHVRDATLIIGETGHIEADVRAARVIVRGTVQGSIAAGERIDLDATANVTGSLTAERVVIADGASFNGAVDMGRRTVATKMAQFKAGQPAARASHIFSGWRTSIRCWPCRAIGRCCSSSTATPAAPAPRRSTRSSTT
jgi:cytoskeletal protein CcmA (bactofilin family)